MSNLPALPAFPSAVEFNTMKDMAGLLVASKLLPKAIDTPSKAIVIMLKGRELGIGPMEAFSKISVINGKPTMDAELMLSMIYRKMPSAVIQFIKTTNDECVIEVARPGGKPTPFSFTIEDAKRADLTSKTNWRQFPAAMLRARVIAMFARAIFPDALSGVSHTPDEVGAETDEDGEVIATPKQRDVTPEEAPPDEVYAEDLSRPEMPENQSLELEDVGFDQQSEKRADYVISFGKFTNLTIAEAVEQVGLPSFQNYLNWIHDTAKKSGKGLPHYATLLMNAYERYAKENVKK